MNAADRGDVVHLVSCCASGPRYVRSSHRADWRCGRCGSHGTDLQVVVLLEDGAIPAPQIDGESPGRIPGSADNTNRGVTPAVAAVG